MNKVFDSSWIYEQDLGTMFEHLHLAQQASPSLLEGKFMAIIIKRLLSCEISVGGPYGVQGIADPEVNLSIYKFMHGQKIELSPLKLYLQEHFTDLDLAVNSTAPGIDHSNIGRDKVFKAAHKVTAKFEKSNQKLFTTQIERIHRADVTGEIALLSQIFNSSLLNIENKFPQFNCQVLGVINIFCWVAYTIYDDIIDERKNCELLPVANLAMRAATRNYCEATADTKTDSAVLEECFAKMDNANLWELEHCRFSVKRKSIIIDKLPDYGNRKILAFRAWAHVAGPITILDSSIDITKNQRTNALLGLEHYLVAKQLNDDLHDWQDDLRNGQASYAVSFLLKAAKVKPGTYEIEKLCTKLQKIFWEHGLASLSETVLRHVEQSQHYFTQSKLFYNDCDLRNLVSAIESSITKGLANYENQKHFLEEFARTN